MTTMTMTNDDGSGGGRERAGRGVGSGQEHGSEQAHAGHEQAAAGQLVRLEVREGRDPRVLAGRGPPRTAASWP